MEIDYDIHDHTPAKRRKEDIIIEQGSPLVRSKIDDDEYASDKGCINDIPRIVEYKVDANQPYKVFSWGSGPLAYLLDDFPVIKKDTGITSLHRLSLAEFVKRFTCATNDIAIGVAEDVVELVWESIRLHLRKILRDDSVLTVTMFTEVITDPDPRDEDLDKKFLGALVMKTLDRNLVDNSRLATSNLFKNNIYGSGLMEMRSNNEIYKQRLLITRATIWAVKRAVQIRNPRDLIRRTTAATQNPVDNLLREALLVMGVHVPDVDLKSPLSRLQTVTVIEHLKDQMSPEMDSYPFIGTVKGIVRYVWRNLGVADDLLRNRPEVLSKRILEYALDDAEDDNPSQALIDDTLKRIKIELMTGGYETKPQIADEYDKFKDEDYMWYDRKYLSAMAKLPPFVAKDLLINDGNILSTVFHRNPSYCSKQGYRFDSVGHAIAFKLYIEALKDSPISYSTIQEDDYYDDEYDFLLFDGKKYITSTDTVLNRATDIVLKRGLKEIQTIMDANREKFINKTPWAKEAARITAASGLSLVQNFPGGNVETVKKLIDSVVKERPCYHRDTIEVTTDSVQKHIFTRYMILHRVSEILNLSSMIFNDDSVGHGFLGLSAVQALATYHGVMEGAWDVPNDSKIVARPNVIPSLLLELQNFAFGRGNNTSKLYTHADEDALVYATQIAVAEITAKLSKFKGSNGKTQMLNALTEFSKAEVIGEGHAYETCKVTDITRALSTIAKRLFDVHIALDMKTTPSFRRCVEIAAMALTVGCTESALNGIVADYSQLYSLKIPPIYRSRTIDRGEVETLREPKMNVNPYSVAVVNEVEEAKRLRTYLDRLSNYKAIDNYASHIGLKLFDRRRFLSMQKIMIWSKKPPMSSRIALSHEMQTKKDQEKAVPRPASSVPVTQAFVTEVVNHMRGAAQSWTTTLELEDLVNEHMNRFTAERALINATTTIMNVAKRENYRFENTGVLLYVASSVMFPNEDVMKRSEDMSKAHILDGPHSKDAVSLESIRAVVSRIAPLIGLISTGVSTMAMVNMSKSWLDPDVGVMNYRPIDYIAPSVKVMQTDTHGPIDISDPYPMRYMFKKRFPLDDDRVVEDNNIELYPIEGSNSANTSMGSSKGTTTTFSGETSSFGEIDFAEVSDGDSEARDELQSNGDSELEDADIEYDNF